MNNDIIGTIEMESGDKMIFELYYDKAPISVANFVDLANTGFYDGLSFHRVVKDFVIQGGSEDNTLMLDSDFHIVGEFSQNGIDTGIKHVRGVLSMARDDDFNTGGTQFSIMHKDAPRLDGKYAAFGKLIDGYDILDKIAVVEVEPPEKENKPLVMQKIKQIRVNTNGQELEVHRLP